MTPLRLLAFTVLAITLTACGTGENKEKEEEMGRKKYEIEKNPVDTIVLRYRDFNSQLLSNGKLRALNKSSLKFASPGIVKQLNVKTGSQVAAGDVIARIDTTEASLKLFQAKSQMEKAVIDLEDKLLGFGYKIQDSLNIPPETMRIARINSGYNSALASLQSARLEYENCTLKAPVDGKIANLTTRLYEYPAGEEFCSVINDKIFEVEFAILETELNRIKAGQKVLVSTFINPEKRYAGQVKEINPTVNEKGQIIVKAQFPNPGHLIDGMNVKVHIENIVPHQFVVPKSAVLIRDNQEVLFRIDQEGKAAWTYIHVLMANSDSYVVVPNEDKGAELREGDIIITSGNLNLAHGSGVEIKQ